MVEDKLLNEYSAVMSYKANSKDISELRARTGAGIGDCKAALEESHGDMEKAGESLRKKGIAKAEKRAGRTAAQRGVLAVAGVVFDPRVFRDPRWTMGLGVGAVIGCLIGWYVWDLVRGPQPPAGAEGLDTAPDPAARRAEDGH